MIVVVASTSPAKIDAVRRAVERIGTVDPSFSKATVRTLDVTGLSPRMPMTDKETLEGARLRASTAARSVQPPFVAIGLEGGLSADPLMTLTSWAAATDGERWGYGAGGRIVLPDNVMAQVKAGRELGVFVGPGRGSAAADTCIEGPIDTYPARCYSGSRSGDGRCSSIGPRRMQCI